MPNYMFKMTRFWKKMRKKISFLHHDIPLCTCYFKIKFLKIVRSQKKFYYWRKWSDFDDTPCMYLTICK
jgi:hypothetical protein